jgi:5-methylcytosine-specific restriction endonuclease McrA
MKLVICLNCGRHRKTTASRRYYEQGFCTISCKRVFRIRRFKSEKKENFYLSEKWRGLRYQALKAQGRICALCRNPEGIMHVDHIKPRSKYPELELEITNLQILCADCNLGKSNIDETDWRLK